MATVSYALGGWPVYKTLEVDTTVKDVSVKYFKKLFSGQRITVTIDTLNGKVPASLSLYGWLPNGSIVELGKKPAITRAELEKLLQEHIRVRTSSSVQEDGWSPPELPPIYQNPYIKMVWELEEVYKSDEDVGIPL
ncbi:hypothetical protein [Pyrodictium abyssi]